MVTPRVLHFDAEGRPLEFLVWLLRARRLLESQVQAHETLWAHASGDLPKPADLAPLAADPTPADSDRHARERAAVTAWKSLDAAACIALSSLLPESEETHFTQVRMASEFLTVIKACNATPTTVSLGRLFLPFLFPDLASFERTADLITHLRSLDSSYHAACTNAQLALLPPPMAITIYFIATSLPGRLASVRDALLLKHPSELTTEVLESALKDVERNFRSVASASGVVPPPMFHGKSGHGAGGGGGGGGGDVASGGDGSAGAGGAPRAAAGDSPAAAGGGDARVRQPPTGLPAAKGGAAAWYLTRRQQQQQQPLPPQQPWQQQRQQQVSGQGLGQPSLVAAATHRVSALLSLLTRFDWPMVLTAMPLTGFPLFMYVPALWGMSASQLVDLFGTPHAMYAVVDSSASDSVYSSVVSLDASLAEVPVASVGTCVDTSPGAAPEDASLSFTLDSRASHCFFRDRTTLTPLPMPVSVALADPTPGPVTARYTTTLPCPAVPSSSLTGFHVPLFSRNLVGVRPLVSQQMVCGLSLLARLRFVWTGTRTRLSPPLPLSRALVAVSNQAPVSGPVAASCSCLSLAHPTVLRHHRMGHPSISHQRAMSSQRLVLGLPCVLPSLPPSLAPPCGPCVEGRLRTTPHSSSLRSVPEPFETLHLDVWGPASRPGPERESFFLVIVDDYSRCTTVFPLAKKSDVNFMLIWWLLTTADTRGRRVNCLHCDCGGEFRSGILAGFCRKQGIRRSWTLPESPQKNGVAERRIGLVMEITCTSMTHACATHFLWPYARFHQSLDRVPWCCVAFSCLGLPGTCSRHLRGQDLASRWFPGFPEDSSDYTFYHPPLHWFFDSRDVCFDESVPYYVRYPCRGLPVPPAPLFLTSAPPPAPLVQPPPPGPAPSGVSHATPPPSVAPQVQPPSLQSSSQPTADPAGAGFRGEDPGGASSRGARVGAESVLVQGPGSGGAGVGAEPVTAGDSSLWGAGVRGAVLGGATTRGAPSAGPGEPGTDPVTSGGAGSGGGATGSLESGPGATTAPDTTPPPQPYPTQHQAHVRCASGAAAAIAGAGAAAAAAAAGVAAAATSSSSDFPPPLPPLSPPLSHTWPSCRSPRAGPSSPVPFTDLRTALFLSSPPRLSPSILPSPPESALIASLSTPVTDYYRTYRPVLSRVLASLATDPRASLSSVSALTAAVTEFASTRCLDYATSLVAAPPTSPLAIGGESALGCDALEDRQLELDFLAAASPHLCAMLLAPEGDPDALDIPTPRTYAKAPSSADPSLFVRRGSTPFIVLVCVDDLVFSTADRVALADVKLKLQKRHTCTYLGELRHYLGLQITRDRAARTIAFLQPHMVQQVLQHFELQHSTVQRTPLAVDHRLTGPFPDEPFEPSGPYVEIVGCLMYLMTCTRPDLAFPLSILARFVAPGRHRPVHWTATVRVAKYLATTLGVGLVLGVRQDVVLTGHCDSSYADDAETHRSTQGYCFSLGSGAVSWRSTHSSSVSTSTAEAEIYARAMAAQELR
ncbi:unnamed protein product [Closterium sp. NIES-54]